MRPLLCFVLMCLCCEIRAQGHPESSESQLRILRQSIDYDTLFAGSFYLQQTETLHLTGRSDVTEIHSRAYSCFDTVSHRLRFDREYDDNVLIYSNTQEESIFYTLQGGAARRYPPNRAPFKRRLLKPVDIRVLGLATYVEICVKGGPRHYDALRDFLSVDRVEEVTKEADTIRATWVYGDTPLRRTVWFDSRQGYRPVRMQEKVISSSEILARCEVQWANFSGVWVPIECHFLQLHFGSSTFSFRWEAVNEAPSELTFQIDGLRLPEGTYIYNSKLGAGKTFFEGRVPSERGKDTIKSTRYSIPSTAWWKSGVAVVVLLVVSVFVLVRSTRPSESC